MANGKDESKRIPSHSEIMEIIAEEMKQRKVTSRQVPHENGTWSQATLGRSKRYLEKYGTGRFFCPEQDKTW